MVRPVAWRHFCRPDERRACPLSRRELHHVLRNPALRQQPEAMRHDDDFGEVPS